MDPVFRTMAIFIEYPFLPAVVGVALIGLGRWTGRGLVVGVGVVWSRYAIYETGMRQRWLCSGE